MIVRSRTASDLDACIAVARVVHDRDGYPPYLPKGDFTRLLVSDDALAVWVAAADAEIVGHVALHRHSTPAVMTLATNALGCNEARLAVVARLLVAPERRREGIATRLLDTAVAHARGSGRIPILDVWTGLPDAIAVYDRLGWRRLGPVAFTPSEQDPMQEIVFVAPGS
jgi:GNAT superfamily N-acetyltransferase